MDARRLRMIMKERHISQDKLAAIAQISQGTISNIINGRVSPKEETVRQIADALNCTVGELVGETEQLTDGDALHLSPWEREIILALRRTGEQGRMMISNALSVPYAMQAREA